MITVLQGDSVEQLQKLDIGSVQLCVTSPPYDDLRSYGADCDWDFPGTASELMRVMCDGGIVCWNVGDSVLKGCETRTAFRQALYFTDDMGFRLHDTMIWHKPNFANPEKVRYHQMFEYIFVFSKGAPRVFNPIKDKPNKYPNGPWGKNTYRLKNGEMKERKLNPAKPFGMRGNVWKGNTVGQESPTKVVHPAMMPHWLARDLIRSWSNAGDVVLDPFAGSGTTGKAALELGRKAMLIEINPKYIDLIHKRCSVTLGLPIKL